MKVKVQAVTVTDDGQETTPFGQKNSCGFARVVFQESSEPFLTVNRACTPFVCS